MPGEQMKLLIAYDGSECADSAIDGLRQAGLPDEADAVVISAADVFVPPPYDEKSTIPFRFMYPKALIRTCSRRAKTRGSACNDNKGGRTNQE